MQSVTQRVPAPLTPEELLARADLAGRARVISVQRLSDDTGRIARLRFESLIKGVPVARHKMLGWLPWGRVVVVKMRSTKREADGKTKPGEWSDGYRAGDTVMTHLVWNPETKFYSTVWWNAVWLAPHR